MALQSDRLAVGLIALGLVLAVLLYSIFVMRAPLQILSVIVPLVFLYLLWRFVRAHERIAGAMESDPGHSGPDRVE